MHPISGMRKYKYNVGLEMDVIVCPSHCAKLLSSLPTLPQESFSYLQSGETGGKKFSYIL